MVLPRQQAATAPVLPRQQVATAPVLPRQQAATERLPRRQAVTELLPADMAPLPQQAVTERPQRVDTGNKADASSLVKWNALLLFREFDFISPVGSEPQG